MTLREKVGQLFVIRPDQLETSLSPDKIHDPRKFGVKSISPLMRKTLKQYPAGGFAVFGKNFDSPVQLRRYTQDLKSLCKIPPVMAIDEEGGQISRIANHKGFKVRKYESMSAIGKSGHVKEAASYIASYLKDYGFNLNFAPVADVNTNPENIVIGDRSFSSDPKKAAPMVVNYMKGLHEEGIAACIKHFPGHGDTSGDSHKGYVETSKSWEELLNCEMITFKAAIKAGAPLIMTAHVSLPKVIGDKTPGTLSSLILTGKLRGELGYKGIIITDAMGMGAISQHYDPAQSAVMCLKAGADIILMPENLPLAFEAVLKAVEDGTLSEERIDESVSRVLALKQSLGRMVCMAWLK